MAVTLETLALQIEVNHQDMTAGLDRASKKVDSFASKTSKSFSLLKVAAVGIFGSQFLRSIVNAASSMEQLEARIKASAGSAVKAEEAMGFLKTMAERQSVSILALADGYTRLLPSVKSGALSMGEMRNILSLVNDNMKAFGVSTNDSKRIFFGLSQLLGSGVVTMENLKQVTEHLPGSMNALAKATGRNLGELIDWVSTGKVTAEMLKGPLTDALAKNEGAAESLGGTYQSTSDRMSNAALELSEALGKAGLTGAMVNATENTTSFIKAMTGGTTAIGKFFDEMEDGLEKNKKFFAEQRELKGKSTFARMLGLESTEELREMIVAINTMQPAKKFDFIGPVEMQGPMDEDGFTPTPQEKPEEAGAVAQQLREDDFMKMQELEERKKEYVRALQREEQDAFREHMGELFKTQMDFAKRFEGFEKLSTKNKIATTVGGLQTVLAEGAKHNKKMFEMNKAAGIVSAIISTSVAIMKAYDQLGPIAGTVAAIGIAAIGGAQIATIASQSFSGGGGGGGGGSVASPSAPITDQSGGGGGGGESGNSLNVAIQGVDKNQMFSGTQVRELISAINDEISNGAIIKGVSVT